MREVKMRRKEVVGCEPIPIGEWHLPLSSRFLLVLLPSESRDGKRDWGSKCGVLFVPYQCEGPRVKLIRTDL